VISALTIKIPEPIILPATIIVASSNPSDGLNSGVVVLIKKSSVWLEQNFKIIKK
jgi:hypothetical protein